MWGRVTPDAGAGLQGGELSVRDVNFWAVFESSPDAYLLLAPDPPRFTMIAANAARLHATMTQREAVLGRPLFEVYPDNPADPEATGVRNLEASLNEVIRTRKAHRMALQKYDIRTPAGEFEERYWDPLNSPVFDEYGRLIYIIHRVEDVTERVTTERRLVQATAERAQEEEALKQSELLLSRLRESEARYRLLADMIPQHIWTTDATGYHRYFSRRWYEFSGATLEETKGTGWLEFLHPDDRERTIERWQQSLRTGEPYSIDYRFRGHDGSYCWFLGQATPLRNEAGEITEWFGTLTDISERKALDREHEQLLAREREAHEQVTTILESITDAFFAVDRQWRFTYLNHEAELLMKRTRAELIGRNLSEEFAGAIGTDFQREYQRAMTEQTTVHFEGYYAPRRAWYEVRAYPTSDGLSVFFRDVSERKRAEEKLRESEERFRTLGNAIPQLAWMADANGWIFWYNDRWHEYTGTTLDDVQGWNWQKLVHADHADRVVARIRQSFESGEPWSDTFPVRSRTGEYRWFLSRALPIRDADGNVVRWFGTNTDVTDERSAAAEREKLLQRERVAREDADRRREEVERVTESRTRLMRGFTHDVKNPLGAADGYAQLLEDGMMGELTPKQLESVRRIRRSLKSSLHLINELMELARAEAGQIEFERATINVAELVLESTEDFRAQATAAGLHIDAQTSPTLFTTTDPTRVRQILSNLLSNAVKYTTHGAISVKAFEECDDANARRCIAISVTDTGPGIPREKQELIFQEFTRIHPGKDRGAGIGLAISRRIARLLGGDITVESEVNHGSTFTLRLPAPSRR